MRSRVTLGYAFLGAAYVLAAVVVVVLLLWGDPSQSRSQTVGRTEEHKVSWSLWHPPGTQHDGRVLAG